MKRRKAMVKILGAAVVFALIGSMLGGLGNVATATSEKTTIYVTDPSPWFTKGSYSGHPEAWFSWTYSGHTYIYTYVGGMSWLGGSPSEPDCWAEFRPYLSQPGRYEVYACFYADPQNSHQVPHKVYYDGGSTTVNVDQYASSYYTWREVKLGAWDFAAGSGSRVVVTDATGEPYDGYTSLNVDTIRFEKVNQPPECSVSADPRSGKAPLDVTFTLSAEDFDGYIAGWLLDIDGDGNADYSNTGGPPATLTHRYENPSPPSGYTVIFMVGDNDGEICVDTETVVVGDNEPPTCSLLASPASGPAPLAVTFSMSASDSDGYISAWVLRPGDGSPDYHGSGSPPSTLAHPYQNEGVYTATLMVSDDKDAIASAFKTITVQPPLAPQVTSVDPPQPVVQPARQPFSILGSGFVEGAEVTLKAPAGEEWVIPRPENPDINVSPTKIDVNAGFYMCGTWQVWVTNPDNQTSNVFNFDVDIDEDRIDGIDVSHWQGDINWSQVRAAGYEFAFVKATEGVGWTDEKFSINMNGAHGAGVLVGAYHFARPDLGNSGAAEAEWFVSVAGDYMTEGYLRPVLDLEKGDEMGWATLSNWVHDFMGTVKSQTGVEPILYTGWYKDYLDISVAQYDLWIAHWTYDPGLEPDIGIWDNWAFWQYSDQGTISGISGNVDLDLFNGDMTGLGAFVISSAQPPQVTTHPATDVTSTSATLHGYLDSLGDYGPAASTREPVHFPFIDDYFVPAEAVVSVETTIGNRYVEYWEHVTDGGICIKNDYMFIHRDIDSNEIISYEKNWREVEFTGGEIAAFEPPGGDYFWKESVAFLDSSDCGDFYTLYEVQEYPLVCWEVRYTDGTTTLYGLDGNEIGYGIPAPSEGLSLSGYEHQEPTHPDWPDSYRRYRENADAWFQEWNPSTASLPLPTPTTISSYVSDPDYRYYYALAHGGSYYLQADSEGSYYYASDAAEDMKNRPPMVFAFIGHCEGMTEAVPGTFSYEFRKGSTVDSVTVGYSGMAGCPGWSDALAWQDYMFQRMDEGYAMRDAFDLASAQYPLIADCVAFAGDPDLTVPPAYVSFEWWADPAHKNETFARPMCTTGSFSEGLTALTPGTTYYFQAKAVADGVVVYGDVLDFLTPAARTITFYTDPTAGGTITFAGSTYSNGQSTTKPDGAYPVSASPASGYVFDHWTTTGGVSVSSSSSQSTTATVSGTGTIKAWFIYTPPQRTITFYTDPTAGGTITFAGSTYSNGQSTTKPDGAYPVSASPASGYVFDHWTTTGGVSVSSSSSQSTTATVSGTGTIKAWFIYTPPQRTITFYTDPTAGGTITFAGSTYSNGQSTTKPDGAYPVSASPASGYVFDHWTTTGGVSVSSSSSQSTTATVSGDGSIKAWFTTSEATVDISVVLQGGSRPDEGWEVPITIRFFSPGADVMTDTPLEQFDLTTTKFGSTATCQCTVAPGTYDITAVSEHTLINVKRDVVISTPSTPMDMGTLLEGNANDDSIINISDFGILAVSYMKTEGEPGYDARADFDRNGIINISDFGLLAVNYMKISPINVSG